MPVPRSAHAQEHTTQKAIYTGIVLVNIIKVCKNCASYVKHLSTLAQQLCKMALACAKFYSTVIGALLAGSMRDRDLLGGWLSSVSLTQSQGVQLGVPILLITFGDWPGEVDNEGASQAIVDSSVVSPGQNHS